MTTPENHGDIPQNRLPDPTSEEPAVRRTIEDVSEAFRRETEDVSARIEFNAGLKPRSMELCDRLLERQNAGTLSRETFGMQDALYISEMEQRPITRSDLGNKALFLSKQEIEALGGLTVLLAGIGEHTIDPDDMNDPVMILFPEDLED